MITIEFCGNPGVGKSTLCEKITSELQIIGLETDSREEWQKRVSKSFFEKVKRKIYSIFCHYYRKYPSLIKKACSVDEKNLKKWLQCIIEVDFFVISSRKKDFVLLDEGIIQFITSISHMKEINSELLISADYAKKEIIKEPYILFNCFLDIDSNINRIRQRQRKDRFFKFSNEELSEQLQLKKKNIDKVSQAVSGGKIIQLDMSDFDRAVSIAKKEILFFYKEIII